MQVRCSNKAFCRLIYVLLLSTLMCLLGTNVVLGQGGGGTLEPDPLIHSMVSQVVSPTVTQYVGGLSGEWSVEIGGEPYTITTRHTDSITPVQKATQFVGEHLDSLGLDVEYHEWEAGRPPNVIGELTGLTDPDDIYIICAHLDDRPSGPVAPGADDNASGSTAVLIAADILSQYQWGSTLRFALWTGEEQGLLGSSVYAQRAYDDGENLLGILNLDQIGYNTIGSSPTVQVKADATISQTVELAQLFADVVDAYDLSLIPEVITDGSGSSDQKSFWNYGYPAILGIEAKEDFNPYYHTTDDLMAHLDIDYLTEFVKAVVGTFAHMSDSLVRSPVGYLEGYVTTASGGEPIAEAKVTANDSAGYRFFATTGSSGYYTRSLLLETYTVTASAYGYLPSTVTDVVVVTDTAVSHNFALETAPTYVVSGTVTSADRGWTLPAHITIQGDPVNPPPPLYELWTDPVTGYYSVTLAGGIAYNFHVEADHHLPQDNAVGPLTGDETRNLALPLGLGIGCAPGYTLSSILYDGFETGDLGDTWSVYTTAQGRVRVDTAYAYTETGSYSVLLDSIGGPFSHAGIVLEQDLTAYRRINLDFWWREYSDEFHSADGVLISDDYGDSWHQAFSFDDDTGEFRNDVVDIAAEAAAHNLTLNDHFQIKFQFYDDSHLPSDGYVVDEVRLNGCLSYISGRVAGYVTDSNTGLPLVGAMVESDDGQSTVTDVDGFYELAETPGSHVFTTTMAGGYVPDIQNPTVVQSTTIQQDFNLPAGIPTVDPISLTVSLDYGLSTILPLTVSNLGGADLDFEFQEEGEDILWLSESPISGTVGSSGSQRVDVTFKAGAPDVTRPGEHYALLHLSNDTPYGTIDVPVTMTVIPVPPKPIWKDEFYINDTLTDTFPATILTSDTVKIVNRIWITQMHNVTFTLVETWTASLDLTGWASDTGETTLGDHTLKWDAVNTPSNAWHVMTGTFHVLSGTWDTDTITTSLLVEHADPQPTDRVVSFNHLYYGVEITPPMDARLKDPGATATYTLVVTNTGNTTDIFDVDVSGNVWATEAPASVGPLSTGEEARVPVTVEVPLDAGGGEKDTVTVALTSQVDGDAWDSSVLTTTANPMYGVIVTPPTDTRSGDPGATVTHTLVVTNTGNTTDIFDVGVNGNVWATEASASVGPLSMGERGEIPVTVKVPLDAGSGEEDTVTVTVTSQVDGDAWDSSVLTTTANTTYGVIVTPPTDTRSEDPGATVTHTLVVTNTGNVTDVFDVDVSGNIWATETSASVGPLSMGERAEIPVTVEVPLDAGGGEGDTVTVTVTSQVDGDAWDSSVLTTTANPMYGVIVTPPTDTRSGDPGATVTHTLIVTNTGNTTDIFHVGVNGNVWATEAPASVGPLSTGERAEIPVTVEVPLDAGGGEKETVTVTLTSQVDGDAWDSSMLTTTANAVYGVKVTPPSDAQSGNPGTMVTYTLQVTNTGNVPDVFSVEVSGNAWATDVPTSVGSLEMEESAELIVTVEVPAGAAVDEEDTVTVTVASQENGDAWSSSVLTTWVRAMTCIEVESVVLSLLTSGDIYPGTAVEFSADIGPETATTPYSYTINYGDGMSTTTNSNANPLTLIHTYVTTGTHAVEVAVWNCGMTIPSASTVIVDITTRKSWIYLPIVTKSDYSRGIANLTRHVQALPPHERQEYLARQE
jgi:uncharacterized membrane protein